MNGTRRWLTLATATLIGSVAACGDHGDPGPPTGIEPEVSTVTVSPDSAKLTEDGATEDFDAEAHDQDGNTMSGVSFHWSVSDSSVATIDGQGRVIADAAGTVTVRAEAEGVTGSSSLVVELGDIRIVSPTPDTAVTEGDTVLLRAVATDGRGDTIPPSEMTWRSDVDGVLGTGHSLPVSDLSVSTHWIVLEAAQDGTIHEDSVTVLVNAGEDRIDRALTREDTAAGFLVGQIGIRYSQDSVSNDLLAQVNRRYDLRSQRRIPVLGVYMATLEGDADSTRRVVRSLRNDDRVEGAFVDALLTPRAPLPEDFVRDTATEKQYHHRLTGTDLLWGRLGVTGGGTTVAVIEKGFDLSHPELRGKEIVAPARFHGVFGAGGSVLGEPDGRGPSAVQPASVDLKDHGTQTASLAVGGGNEGNGILGTAPGARLMPLALGGQGDDSDSTEVGVLLRLSEMGRAVAWAQSRGADVVSISLGSDSSLVLDSDLIETPFSDALDGGVQIVVSSGNCGRDDGSRDQIDPLARVDDRIWAVGGTNETGDDRFEFPSGGCESDYAQSQGGPDLDLVAPGRNIWTATPTDAQRAISGTSASAPIVAGLIAVYLSAGHSPGDISALLEKRTIDLAGDGTGLGTDGEDDRTGHGRVIGGLELRDLQPSTVEPGIATTVTATGRNFGKGSTVIVSGTEKEPVEVVDHTELVFTVTAPDTAADVQVRVRHPSGLTTDSLALAVDREIMWRQISAGGAHSCGVSERDIAYCWGTNGFGELGNGTEFGDSPTPTQVVGGHSFVQLSAGGYNALFNGDYTCGVTSDQTAYCWGLEVDGELGDGTESSTSDGPLRVAGDHSFAQVSASVRHTCAVTTAGGAYCWGDNLHGQVGDGTEDNEYHSPVAVGGGHSFVQISSGLSHTCAVTEAGEGYCWGSNEDGQLGDGTTSNRRVPTEVAGDLAWQSITAGDRHTCGLAEDGTAYCWGANNAGQLGNGTEASFPQDQTRPDRVVGGHSFEMVSAGDRHTCAIANDETAYCWGSNVSGQLGDGTTTARSEPVAVLGGHSFLGIDAGRLHTCAISSDHHAYCWGYNLDGQVGDGTGLERHKPVRVEEPEG